MKYLSSLFFNTVFLFHAVTTYTLESLTVQTAWGTEIISDPCAIKFFNTSLMRRLEGIDQSGPQAYYGIVPRFSRFEHCMGVYLLLNKIGASHKEQLAGAGHDASHTVFSHLGDILFGNGDGAKSYQDGIHIEYLSSYPEVKELLQEYGYDIHDMDPDHEEYTALECDLPDLCADRIQYIIHTGFILKLITQEQAAEIVNNLQFKDGKWFFTDVEIAHRFASISLYCLQALWGGHENAFFYLLFKHILVRALELKLVTAHDLHYSTDQAILDILTSSEDPYIRQLLSYTNDSHKWYEVVNYGEGDISYTIKFRGVNPLVSVNSELKRLTDVHPEYAAEYKNKKEWCSNGYALKLLCDL